MFLISTDTNQWRFVKKIINLLHSRLIINPDILSFIDTSFSASKYVTHLQDKAHVQNRLQKNIFLCIYKYF